MINPQRKVKELEAELVAKDSEIADLKAQKENAEAEIDKLKEQYADEYQRVLQENSAKIAELQQNLTEIMTEASARIEKAEAEAKRARLASSDNQKYHDYAKRLIHPVTPAEVEKVYSNYKVTTTPTFFKLKDENNDILWLLRRNDYLRRFNGYLPNLFEVPKYPLLESDIYLQRALPPDIKSTLEIIFVEHHGGEKTFCFCAPQNANAIIVAFWVEQSSIFQTWQERNVQKILISATCQDRANWRLVTLILPFPVAYPDVGIDEKLDAEDCSAADVECTIADYEHRLRAACQHIYMQHFFLEPCSTTKPECESEEEKEG